MSGIVGILHLSGAPIDRTLLARLTNSLTFRGPDAQRMWCRGQIGLGHTFLQSSVDFPDEQQPFSLDGTAWIVADARVDGRSELIAALRSSGQTLFDDAADSELILRAYYQWGEKCVERLIGDFAVAIWNARTRRLFCARDHLGVKPFFYARLGPVFVFSNTLDCIRRHPAVSERLDDLSIADFLLFDLIQDVSATAFADIRRLPPAHSLVCELGAPSISRYWTPTIDAPVHYPRPADYVERFNELLDVAVADRLRTKSACIFMSGGLDSPTVAASATRVSARAASTCSLWAYTQVFDSLIPHEERHYAGLVARALKIPIEYRSDDHLRPFQFAEDPEYRSPEPVHLAWPDVTVDQLRRVQTVSRVALTGYGADPLFSSRITVHFRELLRQKLLGRAVIDAANYLSAEGRISRLYLRTRWKILLGPKQDHFGFLPTWLNEGFTQRLQLRDRWENLAATAVSENAVRPEAHEVTFAPFWPDLFNLHDAGVTGVPVEVRYPFFDLRLMSYVLALPRLPWCSDKHLLREAARGVLPDEVRLRRKSPLQADPLLKILQRPDAIGINRFKPIPELESYVDHNRIPQAIDTTDPYAAWVHLRPLSLNYWLRTFSLSSIKNEGGPAYEFSTAGDA